jgi:hypothetical protein
MHEENSIYQPLNNPTSNKLQYVIWKAQLFAFFSMPIHQRAHKSILATDQLQLMFMFIVCYLRPKINSTKPLTPLKCGWQSPVPHLINNTNTLMQSQIDITLSD